MTTDITPGVEDQEVQEVAQQVADVVELAVAIEVSTPADAQAATELLARIAQQKKRNEEARKFLVKPLNDHVKVINARFAQTAAPLDEADGVVRGKVLAFRQVEERERAAEQARLDAERREAEQRAEAERRRLALEGQERAAEAARAEEARQREIAEEADERRREIAAMSDDNLKVMLAESGGLSESDVRAAADELDARRNAREAQEAAAAAEQAEQEARVAELQAKSAPAAEVAAPAKLQSASGSAATTKRWTATVIDDTLVPREYLSVDEKKIRTAVREGVREIPGVRIEQVDGLAVRSS
jgi:hypothetical protein